MPKIKVEKDDVIVCLHKFFCGVFISAAIIFVLGSTLMFLTWDERDSVIAAAIIVLFACGWLFCSFYSLSFRIVFNKNKDFFIYRTAFGRTHIIKYSECEYLIEQRTIIFLRAKNKNFYIDKDANNVMFFILSLISHEVEVRPNKRAVELRIGEPEFYLRLQPVRKWAGIVIILMFAGLLIGIYLSKLYDPEDFYLIGLIMGFFIIFGFASLIQEKLWKLTVFKNQKYFIHKNSFGITREVYYKDCKYFKRISGYLILKTTKGFILFDEKIDYFNQFYDILIKNKVKSKHAFDAEQRKNKIK